MSGRLSILAIDDERPALDDLVRMLRASDQVGQVEVAESGTDALAKLGAGRYDALLLDVRMPDFDGVEVARLLRHFENPPPIIFVTAYEDAAVDAFALRAVDYLLKPVSRERLNQALANLRDAQGPMDATPPPSATEDRVHAPDVVPVQNLRGGGTRLVPRSSILYLESAGDYVRLVCDDGRYLVRGHISDFERRWRSLGYLRVHRQYLANLNRALELQPQLNGTALLLFPGEVSIPVSRRQAPLLIRALRR